MRLFALAGLLTLSLTARADIMPFNYEVVTNGFFPSVSYGGYLNNGFISVPNVGVVRFSAYLTPTTANFAIDNSHIYGPPNQNMVVNSVNFAGITVADYITNFKLNPTSTITGIVPSTSVVTTPPGRFTPVTHIDFDFTGANIFPGGTATFDLTFAPQAAPEIDPSLASSALVLLAGAIAILRTRRTRQPA